MNTDIIFSPIKLGNVHIANRIVFSPLTTHYADESGFVTDRLVKWYAERAKGGTGLILVEAAAVALSGKGVRKQLLIDSDDKIPGLKRLADTIKKYGKEPFLQLYHAGRLGLVDEQLNLPVSASSIPTPLRPDITPHSLSIHEISDLIRAFAV